ncbi:DUF4199 domain-containing protein [Flagellimonas crocea]|uniref:DUF4199 domain-containing protein n=1 Tax=Flagellimonas crocea TaxID=3067311 RepID=UPI00296F0E5A|nr:DUF4199 domain-containing protein [Muricauda sp. DH64]
MKKTVLRFGAYGAITICILFMISWFVLDHLSMSTQEVMGYVSIVVSLSFVYFGIRHFRDKENDGKVSFKKALTIGILISLITALTFGLLDVLYTEVLNPDFMDDYYGEVVETMRANLPAAELDAQLAQLEAEREQFSNPFVSFTIMSATVFIIGCIVTLLSSLILQRK